MFKKHLLAFIIVIGFSLATAESVFATPLTPAVECETKTFLIGSKSIKAVIATVDLSNRDISLSAVVTGESIGSSVKLEEIVQSENPVLVISAGIIDSTGPRGNFMSDGELIFTSSGLTSMGITEKNKIAFGKPMIFTRLTTSDNEQKRTLSWAIRDINSTEQTGEQSVLYTPAYGAGLDVANPGWALIVEDSVTTGLIRVETGRHLPIPANGYVVYFSDKFAATTYFMTPEIGRSVSMVNTPVVTDGSEFPLESMSQIISGEARLVESSRLNSLMTGENVLAAGSAVGSLSDGRLIFAYAENVSYEELGQIMLKSGCNDAISLTLGAKCAMYVNGQYITFPAVDVPAAIVIKKNR